jgi:hypothetical protein
MKGRPVWIPASVGVRAQKIYQEAYEKDRRRPGFTVDGIHYALEHYGIPFLYDEPVWRNIADAPLNEPLKFYVNQAGFTQAVPKQQASPKSQAFPKRRRASPKKS